MRARSFRFPLSLGLICGAMASVCYAAGGIGAWEMFHFVCWPGYVSLILGVVSMYGPGLFLALPGPWLYGLRWGVVRVVVSSVIMWIALSIPPSMVAIHWYGGPPSPWSPFMYVGPAYLVTVGLALVPILFLCSKPGRNLVDIFLTALVSVAGLALIAAAAVLALPERHFVMLQYWEGAVILLGGPWLGLAMWNTPGIPRPKATPDA